MVKKKITLSTNGLVVAYETSESPMTHEIRLHINTTQHNNALYMNLKSLRELMYDMEEFISEVESC